ncbi:GTPase ObgE [Filifactor villosus]|uniref:GTPase Obg n=1 Tax=Filifactor villosus TaxID=29374 RepID=A0ABV9QM05_9FIRM
MFIDKAKIYVKAGNGGNGAVAFRREIYVPAGGPAGGDGGNGGNVIFRADSNLRTLMDFKYKKSYIAPSGEDGKGSNMYGKKGEDLVLLVPVGTVIRDEQTGLVIADLKENAEESVVAKGGRGGKGNTHFKSSIRQAPNFAKAGTEGQERNVLLELKLIADVGLLGFPNVGKSTFLSIVTKANPKIANYHFTTLTPNLGVVKLPDKASFVIADIPGIIEGAHEGVGLGHDFLRHIERTRLLLHIVDISGIEGREPYEDFLQINRELTLYNEKLAQREQIVIANKMDLLFDKSAYNEFKERVENDGYKVFPLSGATKEGLGDVLNYVSQRLSEIEEEPLYSPEDMWSVEDDRAALPEDEIRIEMVDGVYVIEGEKLEKLLYSVNFDDMESIRYFQRVMEQNGVFDRLRSMGIDDGDTVRMYDLEFEFFD